MKRNNEVKLVMKFLREKGGTGNVMEALGWDVSKFDQGFAFANELQNQDLVKLLYSNFNTNLVVIELTLLGYKKGE